MNFRGMANSIWVCLNTGTVHEHHVRHGAVVAEWMAARQRKRAPTSRAASLKSKWGECSGKRAFRILECRSESCHGPLNDLLVIREILTSGGRASRSGELDPG